VAVATERTAGWAEAEKEKKWKIKIYFKQGCGSGYVSGSGLDPDSIGSVDPDPEFGSGSRRAKITHKSRNFF
jgi:hypothetical protein